MTIAELRASRVKVKEPLSPTIKSFIDRFADPSVDYGLMVNNAAVRTDLKRAFDDNSVFGGRAEEIGQALDNIGTFETQLRKTLKARTGENALSASEIDSITKTAVQELEKTYVAAVQQDIVNLVERQCDAAVGLIGIVDVDASTRRAWLGQVAFQSDTLQDAIRDLKTLGVNASDAEEIAGILMTHAKTVEDIHSLMAGRRGSYDETQRAFETAEQLLDKSLNTTRANIQQLRKDVSRQTFKYGSPLHSPKYNLARAEVMRRHGLEGPNAGHKAEVFTRHAADYASSKETDDVIILLMNTSFALVPVGGVGVVSKAVVGAALSSAGNAPGLLVSGLEKDTSHASMIAKSGTTSQFDNASRSHNIAMAAAAAQLVAGGVITATVVDDAAATASGFIFDAGTNVEAKVFSGLMQE